MDNGVVAAIGFASLFILMLLRVPVGMAMGLVGITGFGYLTGFAPALKLVGQATLRASRKVQSPLRCTATAKTGAANAMTMPRPAMSAVGGFAMR